MSNIISRPFRFSEHQKYIAPTADESTWSPLAPEVRPPESTPTRVLDKFIYVFQRLGDAFVLHAELFSDSAAKLSIYSGRDARAQARDKRGQLVPTGSDVFTLPHTINGKRAYYTFVVSRIRLPADAIAAFESRMPIGLIADVDLASDNAYVALGADSDVSTITEWWLGVTDPLTIALRLHETYERACNELIFYTTEYEGQPADQRRRVVDRHKSILLAKLLKGVFDNDPSDKLGLNNELRNGRDYVSRFIADYERTVEHLIKERDTAGETLCFFLNGHLLELTEESYRLVEEEDYHRWVEIYSTCMERLGECPMGKARLGKLAQSPNHTVREYVLRDSIAGDKQFAVGRKCTAAIVNLWKEFVPALLANNMPDVANRLVDSLANISRVTIAKTQTKTITYTYKKKNGRLRTVTKQTTEIVHVEDIEKTLANWAENGVAGKSLGRLVMGIEVANLVLALRSWLDADPQESSLAALNAFGSMLDAVSAFNCMLKLGNRAIKIVGGISAVVDAVLATSDGIKAYARDDASSAVGFGAVALGSVLTLAGCACAVFGVAASATVVGIPLAVFLEIVGAVLVAAGWLIAVLTEDSDIEQFVSHSKFGINFPSKARDPAQKPKWATAPFGDWSNPTDGLDHQINSLMLLLAAFKMEAPSEGRGTTIRVTLGMHRPESKLKLHFRTLYNNDILHDALLLVDITNQTMRQLGGTPQDLTLLRVSETEHRTVVEVRAQWPNAAKPQDAVLVTQCSCDVLLLLDDNLTVPTNSQPYKYFVSSVRGFRTLGHSEWSYD